MLARLKDEWLLALALLIALLAYGFESMLLDAGRVIALTTTVVLIVAIVATAIRVAHHAEVLAEKVGDPYGTMILTLSAVLVEVIILVIVMSHEHSPTLARDTIYAAVMIDTNGIVGLAALIGGLKHGEQPYNDDSSKVYVVMIITAVGISMLLPEFLPEARWPLYSGFTICAMALLYSLFLRMQTGPHSYFFSYSYPEKRRRQVSVGGGAAALGGAGAETASASSDGQEQAQSAPWSIGVLVAGVALTGALAEVMSQSLGAASAGLVLPPMLVAIVVAMISASPEILTALRAALANRMQSVINIALGASLSTVILTIPVIEAISLYQGERIVMALTPVQTVMMALTLIVAAINLNDGETNAIEGMTHFVLFATFVMLSLIGL
ncbi:calcium:proton antiporter [Halotalea alkalilenta]|uniref:Calcium:proton antiporter n=1 Tax=Halotalea alkalilenta TaxID=376489 RepID=A0A172YC38_9GAMM|nr:calcium:proton antiporter [Halotalea alkalilenta]ANF56672.1 calcium:proton antiporter [Halotalea alkalilenta]